MSRISIGEFARESGLTPKALRLYDELGLLPPAEVDPRSGYRYYDRGQLERARLVVALRGIGMPLARIRSVCGLAPGAAAAEIASYWRQVESDTAARGELAALLISRLSREDVDVMSRSETWELRAASRSETGLVRRINQDAVSGGTRLFAIADGFGPSETPSRAALDALAPLDAEIPTGKLLAALGAAVGGVREAVAGFGTRPDRGTTLTAMLWSGSSFALAHIGDTRCYRLRGGELSQLTQDHTFVQSLVDEGKLTAEEAAVHPQRATLTRALQGDADAEPDLLLREAHPGDRYLLCTDGISSVLDEPRIQDVLADADGPRAAVDRLADLVDRAGAPDNHTSLVLDTPAP
ncbi:MerR family transcriptional regulator [Saccharopolyspora griseoalba]|uniref:MerR family transcriptional regulator n=1 Tax=Saccharopolyspora griseoalba TaxID=1431848 RepID=A0ABW2LMB3_9PSEU